VFENLTEFQFSDTKWLLITGWLSLLSFGLDYLQRKFATDAILPQTRRPARALLAYAMIILLIFSGDLPSKAFIYFQF
jgi:hypothetical protein